MLENIIDNLELTTQRLLNFIPEKKRLYFDNIDLKDIRAALIYGQRGVGKTTFLLNEISKRNLNFLYISADNPIISAISLYELISDIFTKGYDGVVIDEVHHANKWSIHIKALYDDYPNKVIWISDSSNLILKRAVSDLSRRFVQFKIPLMSFREYIAFVEGIVVEPVNPFDIDKNILKQLKDININRLFKDYLNEGFRPIFVEKMYCERLKALIDKSIYHDVPFYVSSIQDNHLRVMSAVIGYLINSPVPTLNITSLCNEWNIGKEKLYNLLAVMEQAEILNIVKKKGKTNQTRGAKIFFSDPSVYYCFNGNKGTAREAFVVTMLKSNFKIYASKDEKECDFFLNNTKIEIGGKNKKRKNADFVIMDNIDVPFGNKIPLWVCGMVY